MTDRQFLATEWALLELLQEAAALLDEMPQTFDRGQFEKGLHALRDQVLQGPDRENPGTDFDAPSIPNLTE